MTKINWTKDGAGFKAEMPGNVTLYVTPDRTQGLFGEKPARGTFWRAGASHWEESTRTMSPFGRDTFREQCENWKKAQRLAEEIYAEQLQAA